MGNTLVGISLGRLVGRTVRCAGAAGAIGLVALAACSGSTASQGVVQTTAATPATATASVTAATPTTGAASDSAAPATEVAPTEAVTTQAAAAQGGTVTIGLDSEPATLDPAANSISLASGSVFSAMYETLMARTPGSDLTNLLAKSLTEAPDRLSWTLVVRDGVTFHDGTPFDAAAVKFNLERQKASLYNGSALLPLTGIDVVDATTVTLHLSEPWTALPDALSGIVGVMVSPTAAADAEAFKRAPVGTGPYRLTEWVPGDKASLVRFDGYWGEKAPLDAIVFKFISVEAARIAAFDAGEIDAYTTIIDATAADAKSKGAVVVNPPPTGYGFSYVNLTKPPLDDLRVRQAMRLAVDQDAIADAYQGQGYADFADSPFYKKSEWWVAPTTAAKYDPEGATALIKDYGKPVKITFKLLAGSQEIEDSVRATIGYWKDAGIDCELVLIPDLGTYIGDVLSGNYDALGFIGTSSGDPDAVTYNLFHTGGSGNYGKYSNPTVDAALETGRHSQDLAERKAAYATVQQELRKDIPVLFSSHGSIFIVAKPELKGIGESFFFPARTVSR